MRVEHPLFGHGEVIEARITESGKSAYLVQFDGSESAHLILADSLTSSKSSAPGAAPKKGRKKPTRARKADPADESISDRLLVPELDDTLANAGEPETDETQALEAR
jgi:hypothetical protein